MIKRILCKDNFEVWHKYNRMEAAVGELRGFIDAGILDVCPDVLIRRFVEAEALCEDFYRTVQHTVGSTGAIQFDIDFKSGIYDVSRRMARLTGALTCSTPWTCTQNTARRWRN